MEYARFGTSETGTRSLAELVVARVLSKGTEACEMREAQK
jgi:hypothetical protein